MARRPVLAISGLQCGAGNEPDVRHLRLDSNGTEVMNMVEIAKVRTMGKKK